MALTLVGVTTAQRACELAETGINLDSYSCRYYPQFRDELNNYLGQVIGFAVPTLASSAVTITGEVLTGGTGVMAFTFLAASTVANDHAAFGGATGGLYMTEATEDQSRDGWRRVSVSLVAHPLLA
jgi:hypothetical protein